MKGMKLKELYTSMQFEDSLVCDGLIKRFKKGTVYSPFKDKGVDLSKYLDGCKIIK